MQLRAGDVAGLAGIADDLALGDIVAAAHNDALGMGVGGDVAVVMLDEHEIAVAAQLVAGIADLAGRRGMDRRAQRRADIDAGIAFAAEAGAVVGNDRTRDRPGEGEAAAGRDIGRGLRRRRRGGRHVGGGVPAGLGARRRAIERRGLDRRRAAVMRRRARRRRVRCDMRVMRGVGRGIPVELGARVFRDAAAQENRGKERRRQERGRAMYVDVPNHFAFSLTVGPRSSGQTGQGSGRLPSRRSRFGSSWLIVEKSFHWSAKRPNSAQFRPARRACRRFLTVR